jgi:Protein of unknown function (DUF3606)
MKWSKASATDCVSMQSPYKPFGVSMAAKKTAAKKTTAKTTSAKKSTVKKSASAAKPAAKKVAKPAAKKSVVKKAAAKKTAPKNTDRARVSSQQHELSYVAKKHGVSEALVKKAITKVGNLRSDVEKSLLATKKRSAVMDKALVSKEAHEIAALVKKFKSTKDKVLAAIAAHGPSRKKVEAALSAK